MSDRVIVAVKHTPVAAPVGLRKAVGAFLRYVQYRDKHADQEPTPQQRVDGELRYVAHRDRAAGHARLFGPDGTAGDEERRALAAFVARAAASTRPQLTRGADGALIDRRRAVYRFVISPEHAEGLDLRALTLAAVEQLEGDAGGALRWIAAEHRNTAHPHVHLVVAGFRELESERFRSFVLTKPRLQRIKDAVVAEICHERGRAVVAAAAQAPERARQLQPSGRPGLSLTPPVDTGQVEVEHAPRAVQRSKRPRLVSRSMPVVRRHERPLLQMRTSALRRMAARYRWQAEREAAGRQPTNEMEVG